MLTMDRGTLQRLDDIRGKIARISDIPEAKLLRDKVSGIQRVLSTQRAGLRAQNEAAQLKILIERKLGKMLTERPKHPGAKGTGSNQYRKVPSRSGEVPKNLEELGIHRAEAHRWMMIASIPEAYFEEELERIRATDQEITSVHFYREAQHIKNHATKRKPLNVTEPVYTSYRSDNGELIARVASIYFPQKKGLRIADVTYGKGVFLKNLDLSKHELFASDIVTGKKFPGVKAYDFKKLPYENNFFDVMFFDPPYHHVGKRPRMREREFRNVHTTGGYSHKDILALYRDGMKEGFRVLKKKGVLLVKTMDEIESGKQYFTHIEIFQIAQSLGFVGEDLFILTQVVDPPVYQKRQLHAQKNHSLLWVFRKK